jgi:hypothetical protein
MKEVVKTSPYVIGLLDELEKNAQLYNALSNYSDPFWLGHREQRKRIKEIELFKEKQALPLLLAAYNNFSSDDFSRILRIVSVITFRYTIIAGLHTNLKEDVYNKAAIKISNHQITSVAAVAHEVKPLYIADRDFKNNFSTSIINTRRNKKLVRYILFELENNLSGSDRDYEDDPGTIEHVLPENPGGEWLINFSPAIVENFVYRLGNYTILEEDKNRNCGNKNFAEKKIVYATSQYAMPKQITANDWTPNTIDMRQTRLSETATAVWRLPYFD